MRSGEANGARERVGAFTGAPVTFYVLLTNLAIFAGEVIASRSLASLAGVSGEVLLTFGANYAPLTLGLGQYDRLVACCFLHGNLLHVAMNMWALRQIGPFAERTVGSARYAVMYAVTGIAGSLSSVLWAYLNGRETLPSVGASGAICGVMGAALVLGVRLEGWQSGIARQIGFWLLVTVLYGATAAHIDNAAHVGGAVTGCVIAALWRRGIHYSTAATLASIGLSVAVWVGAGAAVVWRDATDPYGQLGRSDRYDLAARALANGDCREARRALAAAGERMSTPTPELVGLQRELDRQCPRGR